MSAPVTGRFAPTPSGRLHLGNVLCALLAYLSCRKAGGRFLLRIEDLDVPRCPQRLTDQCISDLRALGFDWDEEPLQQSRRQEIYAHYLEELTRQGLVYPCFCTRAQLMASQAPNLGDTQVVYNRACLGLPPEEIARLSARRSPALRLRVPEDEVADERVLACELAHLGIPVRVGQKAHVDDEVGLLGHAVLEPE